MKLRPVTGTTAMALDDNEQRILAEIERQFYAEDPELAHAVRHIRRPARVGVRLAVVGVVAGLSIIILTFATNTWLALGGFALLVTSAAAMVSSARSRATSMRASREPEESE